MQVLVSIVFYFLIRICEHTTTSLGRNAVR